MVSAAGQLVEGQAAADAGEAQQAAYNQANLRTQGKLADMAGESARTGFYFAAGSTLLRGVSNAAMQSVKMGNSEFA